MRIFKSASIAFALLAAVFVTGCGENTTVVYNNAEIGCPVPQEQLQTVLAGTYGVDAERRPVNERGFAVDINGRCLMQQPVANVYQYQPAPIYITHMGILWPGYVWYAPVYRTLYTPGYAVVVAPRTVVPAGRVTTVTTYKPVGVTQSVTVKPGAAQNVRPGAPASPAAGPTQNVRPGAAPATPATPGVLKPATPPAASQPATIAPTGGGPKSDTFKAPAPAASQPATIAPKADTTSGASKTFNAPQPSAPSRTFSAPAPSAPSRTFSAPAPSRAPSSGRR